MIESVKLEDKDFEGEAYTSLAVIYAVFALCNWMAPSVISLVGPKISMILGAFCYLFMIMIFLKLSTWLLYFASAVVGVGAAMIWTGQGNYLTLNSSPATISRNSGVFWAMLQASMFIGNLFVFFTFQGKDEIDEHTRTLVIWVLSGIAMLGIVLLIFLPRIRKDDTTMEVSDTQGPISAFKGAAKLFVTKRMMLLSVTFFYTGIELSFFSGVYSSSIGFTAQFGADVKRFVGLSGILIGIGEVLGGALFGILGAKTNRWGRDPIVMGGFVIHILAFFLIFLNLPDAAPFGRTENEAFITSSAPLAIFCSFLLGFGDACYNTQLYSLLGGVYSDNSASAFAIFKFIQSVAAAACFFYADYAGLYIQLGILLLLAVLGTITFVSVEWQVKREARKEVTNHAESCSDVSSNQESP